KALLDVVGDDLVQADDKLPEALPSVARAIWRTWGQNGSDADRRAAIDSLVIADIDRAQLASAEIVADAPGDRVGELIPASPGELRLTSAEIAEEIGAGWSGDTRVKLSGYLEQVPSSFRR